MLQQLAQTDASFLYMETAETPMHVGSLYLYELPPGYHGDFYEDFKAWLAGRIHLFPIFTRKLVQLPFDIDAPVWVEDDNIDLDYHVRRHTVPKPGRFDQLEELAGRLHSNFLDRSRPLWEIYIIDGLADGRVAEFTKFHHAGFDGSAAMALIQQLYDTTPVPRPVPPPTAHKKEEADLLNLMGLLFASPVRQYLRAMRGMPDLFKVWSKMALPDPETLRLVPPELPPLAPLTRLNVAITSQRSYAARTVSLKEVKQVAKANGVTVNDVVLAICSGALRRYLRGKKDLPADPLTAFVPISVREAGNLQMSIQTIGMICSLATDVADPVKRLRAIHDSAQKAKYLTDMIKPALLGMSLPWGTPFLAYGFMNILGHYRLTERMRPLANLAISNMISSPMPLYLAGAKLVANYPISIPTHGSALNITVQSYCDNLDIGLTACRQTVPDVRKLGDYAVNALAELKAATFGYVTAQEAAAAEKPAAARGGAKKRRRSATKKVRASAARAPAPSKEPKAPRVLSAQDNPVDNARRAQTDISVGPAAANALKQSPDAQRGPVRSNGTARKETAQARKE
jgi:diacylglycerol O-acyltransferase / wax synthase